MYEGSGTLLKDKFTKIFQQSKQRNAPWEMLNLDSHNFQISKDLRGYIIHYTVLPKSQGTYTFISSRE